MSQLDRERAAAKANIQLKRAREVTLARPTVNLLVALNSFVVNIVAPIAGVLPLSFQTYLRDQSMVLFRQLDPRTAVSASAIYLLAFSLIGINDIIGGTILAEGISITYPFPQKEFGEELIRQMPLIELNREHTVFLLLFLFFDSCLRLFLNHVHGRPMGVMGPVGLLFSRLSIVFGDSEAAQKSVCGLVEQLAEEQVYQEKVSEQKSEGYRREAKAFSRFLKRNKEKSQCV